jgi:hypothetical protein
VVGLRVMEVSGPVESSLVPSLSGDCQSEVQTLLQFVLDPSLVQPQLLMIEGHEVYSLCPSNFPSIAAKLAGCVV